jgi:hypothetical protein
MTEAEWLASGGWGGLLDLFAHARFQRATERERRLFACACCRHIWQLLVDERSQRAVEIGEALAEQPSALEELYPALVAARKAFDEYGDQSDRPDYFATAMLAAWYSLNPWAADGVAITAGDALARYSKTPSWNVQCSFLRDILGNPFRTVAIHDSLRNPTVVALAQAIYSERAFERLPILADALEDAGCTDAEILNHCRGGGIHVRGCWAVDLLLDKT